MNIDIIIRCTLVLTLLSSVANAESTAKATSAVNPKMSYILSGEMVAGWSMQLGDPSHLASAVTERRGKSASGKVSVNAADYLGRGDALKFVWSRANELGSVELLGAEVDLSSVENTAALVLDMKIETSPNKAVMVGMSCGPSCRGVVDISNVLIELKKSDWTAVPIALNCFTQAGLNIKKVVGPLTISTEGKLTLLLTNVRLQKLQEGDKSCAVADAVPAVVKPLSSYINLGALQFSSIN
jgi:Galactose-binding domain-like